MKKILPILLILQILAQAMLLAACVAAKTTPPAEQPKAEPIAVWNGTADTAWYNDTITEFTITTSEQLAGLAKLVNDSNDFNGKTIRLGANIMLNDTVNWRSWAYEPPANEWIPIGTIKYPFGGTFNGNGFTVSGVYINNSSELFQGLFGAVIISDSTPKEGGIENLGLIASHIKGDGIVGGLAGFNRGTISNNYSTAFVTGRGFVGGLVGINARRLAGEGVISNSYFNGEVKGQSTVGGLVGLSDHGIINNSYSIGKVAGEKNVGGFVGDNAGKIENSYSAGEVLRGDSAGGFIGWNIRAGNLFNCHYDKETSKQNNSVGKGEDEDKIVGKTAAEMKQKSTYKGWDFDTVWGISGEVNGGYPYLLH